MSEIILRPKISEKAISLAESGVYVFEVSTDTDKAQVTRAVEARFKVEVTDVNVMVTKGKLKRFKGIKGRQRDRKKVLVTLKKGQKIKLFEGGK
jgi:large subunit ribosomal protein L23